MKIQLLLVVAALLICCYSGSQVAGQTPGNDSKQKSATKIEVVGIRNETIWRGKIPPNGLVEHDSSRSVAKEIPETKRNEFAWRGKVPPDGLVEIIGISGDIRTEISTGDEVEVIAIKDGAQDEIDQVQIRVEESANGVKVCAAFPLLEGQGQPECLADGRWNSMSMSQSGNSNRKLSLRYESGKRQSFRVADIRVQFKVRIPAGTPPYHLWKCRTPARPMIIWQEATQRRVRYGNSAVATKRA
jgi:hypothetical protein